ncbi:S8 family serine peptidase [Pectobacterium brasiliense]|uniref:S8 family serine peptidase n=1 Tax=Pectobacterium TaxID=122277 RepID=UPI000E7578B0|nr:S8 family serine peptidase [Pectobacterium carotovorum]RJL48414.1 hypothetical protein D5078_03060 [Pectobacterium carotovorum]
MADNINSPLLNPIISLLKSPSPSAIKGGGKSRASIVQSRLQEQKKKLVGDLRLVSENVGRVVSHAGHIHVIARMFDDSLAPSYTPDDLFVPEVGARIIAPTNDGYLIEFDTGFISKLIDRVSKSNTITQMVDVSRVKYIDIFSEKDVLRNRDINDFWKKSKENEMHQFNIWLMPFFKEKSKESVVNEILNLYNNGAIHSGYPEFDFSKNDNDKVRIGDKGILVPEIFVNAIRKYKKTGNSSLTVLVKEKNNLKNLLNSSAVYRIEPVSQVSANEVPPGVGPEPTPPINNSSDLPTVVVIDGGCSAKSYEPLNILRLSPLISDVDADKKHGNQIVSVICHGYAWNNNLSLPHLECNFISAQAIAKRSVLKQPTSDQFIMYLRKVAQESSGKSKVWNLSFNEGSPSLNESEISYLGHKINEIAREFDILPVISIGNVNKNNPNKILCPPADCEAAITVSGRISDSEGKPYTSCPYSLKGPAPAGMKKPELSWFSKLRVIGGTVETGTSYSAPLISAIAAHTFANLKKPTPDLVRALLINRTGQVSHDHSLGWGTPWEGDTMPWLCKKGTVTLTWISKLKPGFAFYWNDIPLPPEMLLDGKLCGSISLTAVLKPKVSDIAGENYFSTRLECALQHLKLTDTGLKVSNLLGTMRESKEKEHVSRAELSKWSPIRHHSRDFKRASIENTSLRLYSRIFARDLYQYGMESHQELEGQEVAFVLTFKSSDSNSSIYDSMTQKLGAFVESAVINQGIDINL